MVLGERCVLYCPEPADYDAVPDPGSERFEQSRLRLGRTPANDDRPDQTVGIVVLPDDDACPHAHGGRKAVRRCYANAGIP